SIRQRCDGVARCSDRSALWRRGRPQACVRDAGWVSRRRQGARRRSGGVSDEVVRRSRRGPRVVGLVSDAPVLVTGAPGRQGGGTVRALQRRGIPVRALSRSPDKPAAKALASSGVEIARGDLDDVSSLVTAMAGVRGVFSVQNWWETGATREIRQG